MVSSIKAEMTISSKKIAKSQKETQGCSNLCCRRDLDCPGTHFHICTHIPLTFWMQEDDGLDV